MRLLLTLFFITVMFACGTQPPGDIAVATIGGAEVRVEVADSTDERRRGLSRRSSLELGTGMLFVPDSGKPVGNFWMKEMEIPLDFVWVDKNCRVSAFAESVQPPTPGTPDSELPRIKSPNSSIYTIELNSGELQTLGIELGDVFQVSGYHAIYCAD